MKDVLLVVTAEVPASEIDGLSPEQQAQTILELIRRKADEVAARDGGRIRLDRMPELTWHRATHALLQTDFILVYSEWHAVVPEAVQTDTGRPE